jgi:hypothetical protein
MAYRRHRVSSPVSPDINGSEYLLLYFSLCEQFTVLVFVMRPVAYRILGTLSRQLCGLEVEERRRKTGIKAEKLVVEGRYRKMER